MAHSRWRSRLPVLAVVTGLAVAGCTSPDSTSPKQTAPSSSTTESNVTPPSGSGGGGNSVESGRVVGRWKATTVGGPLGHAVPLAGTHTSLYLRDNQDLVRMDVTTGRIEARQRVGGAFDRLLIVGGLIWDIPASSPTRRLVLTGLDPMTLRRVRTVPLPGTGPPGANTGVTSDARDQRLYVGVGHTIFVVGTRHRHIVARYHGPGRSISGLALDPSRTRLYVTWDIPNSDRSGLAVVDPRTGAVLTGPVLFYGGTTASSASAGGVWVANGQAMTQTMTFQPADNLGQTAALPVTYAGGGWVVDSTVGDDVVWIAGTTMLACADPRTGRVRARSRLVPRFHRPVNISSLVIAGGRLFAYRLAQHAPARLLIRLHPPVACRN